MFDVIVVEGLMVCSIDCILDGCVHCSKLKERENTITKIKKMPSETKTKNDNQDKMSSS